MWETYFLMTYLHEQVHLLKIHYELHWVGTGDTGRVSCSLPSQDRFVELKERHKWQALKCLLLSFFNFGKSVILSLLIQSLRWHSKKKKVFNRFLGILTIEADLYLVNYIIHMEFTSLPRVNKNWGVEEKKQQR